MASELFLVDLNAQQFAAIRDLLYETCGIKLSEGKEGLVKSRLMKRLRHLGFSDYGQYVDYLGTPDAEAERHALIDALTTNKTSFFRENQHFIFLRERILPNLPDRSKLRIWSAGCSAGHEPFSIAMELRESMADRPQCDVRILATDISSRVLAQAREATYDADELQDIPPALAQKYFTRVHAKPNAYQVSDSIRQMVRFAPLNLMGDWPMRGPFRVIFCRNVMIYFDKPTQQWLVQRFWELLEPGGYLMVGHSESLTGSAHQFKYVQPATYIK
jgi:chemotaxis protein methyltransferase CheR